MKKKNSSYLRILLIAVAIVLVWRGAWGLMDLYVFPDHDLFSYITSLVVGLLILVATRKLTDLI